MTGATGPAPTEKRNRPGIAIALLLPAVTIGLFVSTQIRAQSDRSPFTTRYQLTLVEVASDLQRQQTDLRAELTDLREELDQIQRDGALLDSAAAALQPGIDALKREAGLVEERGPGIVVTLDDARLPPGSGVIEPAIVHAADLTDVFNVAWRAGARAISVNGERIVGTSSCVGATIQINGALMSPPFVISVVGPPDAMVVELNQGPGLADLRRRRDVFGLGFDLRAENDLVAPVFAGPIRARYATVRP
jgi:uncharacterized protein YlxW (UPF0749 family)